MNYKGVAVGFLFSQFAPPEREICKYNGRMDRRLIVTHNAPDLDATGSVWLLKRFDAQHFATAKVAFVNPGQTLSAEQAARFEIDAKAAVHVDTGLGEFDHHQPDRGLEHICASSLVYDHLCQLHPELKEDRALQDMVAFITDIDHFGEIYWPDASHARYSFMIHELIRGFEFTTPHDDDSQLHFAMTCLDCVYGILTQQHKALSIIAQRGKPFSLAQGKALALETNNDDVLKVGQKQGYVLVVRKDPDEGHVRIKVRPDVELDLREVYEHILRVDQQGTWYYHPSGKMLLNGSHKHHEQTATTLELDQVVELIKKCYA